MATARWSSVSTDRGVGAVCSSSTGELIGTDPARLECPRRPRPPHPPATVSELTHNYPIGDHGLGESCR